MTRTDTLRTNPSAQQIKMKCLSPVPSRPATSSPISNLALTTLGLIIALRLSLVNGFILVLLTHSMERSTPREACVALSTQAGFSEEELGQSCLDRLRMWECETLRGFPVFRLQCNSLSCNFLQSPHRPWTTLDEQHSDCSIDWRTYQTYRPAVGAKAEPAVWRDPVRRGRRGTSP